MCDEDRSNMREDAVEPWRMHDADFSSQLKRRRLHRCNMSEIVRKCPELSEAHAKAQNEPTARRGATVGAEARQQESENVRECPECYR